MHCSLIVFIIWYILFFRSILNFHFAVIKFASLMCFLKIIFEGGADPNKPPSRKAKLMRLERKKMSECSGEKPDTKVNISYELLIDFFIIL